VQQSVQPRVVDRSHRGAPLPEITVRDAAGEELGLPSLTGKPALINLWATWCAPCVAELPTLNSIASRADLNLEVVTISQDAGEPEKVESFHYGAGMLPTSILYDAGGREVWRYAGEKDWTSEDALKLLAEAGVTGK
jgi:thiol-disulfide isomerase/thioredoxin